MSLEEYVRMTGLPSAALASGHDQPKILLVMADQLAPHFTGAYGHPLVRTPAMAAGRCRGPAGSTAAHNNPAITTSFLLPLPTDRAASTGCVTSSCRKRRSHSNTTNGSPRRSTPETARCQFA